MATSTVQNRTDAKSDSRADVASCPSQLSVLQDFQCYTQKYVQDQPEKAALICLGVGFILGWKLKPW